MASDLITIKENVYAKLCWPHCLCIFERYGDKSSKEFFYSSTSNLYLEAQDKMSVGSIQSGSFTKYQLFRVWNFPSCVGTIGLSCGISSCTSLMSKKSAQILETFIISGDDAGVHSAKGSFRGS